MSDNEFSFEGFNRVNIKTGKETPLDKDGNPISESEAVQDEVQDGSR